MDFRYQRHFKAPRGEHGMSKNQHGRNAEDMIVKVPPGTVVTDEETKEVIADLVEHGQRASLQKVAEVDEEIHVLLHQQIQHQKLSENGEPGKKEMLFLN